MKGWCRYLVWDAALVGSHVPRAHTHTLAHGHTHMLARTHTDLFSEAIMHAHT